MRRTFSGLEHGELNSDVSKWDTGNVKTMEGCFAGVHVWFHRVRFVGYVCLLFDSLHVWVISMGGFPLPSSRKGVPSNARGCVLMTMQSTARARVCVCVCGGSSLPTHAAVPEQ